MTSQTQPEPCIERAVWNIMFLRAAREPNESLIFARRVKGIVGSVTP